jgi:hypothetical protein
MTLPKITKPIFRLVVWGGDDGKLRHVTTARPFGRGLWKKTRVENKNGQHLTFQAGHLTTVRCLAESDKCLLLGCS